jgi:PAS domain S-box-containing protein
MTHRDLFQEGLNQLDQGVSVFDANLDLVAYNRRFLEFLELPEALVAHGTSFADIARHLAEREASGMRDVEDDVARRVAAARSCVRSYSERTTHRERIVAAQTTPLLAGGFVTVYTDITERSLAETLTPARKDELEARVNQRTLALRTANEQLRENIRRLEEASAALANGEARQRLITDAIPAAIAYVDDRLILRFANRLFAALFRRSSDRVIGRSLRQVLGAKLLATLSEHIDAAFRGEQRAFEHAYLRSDGAKAITDNKLVPELGPGARVTGFFVLSIDATDERRAARAVVDAQKMSAIGQLAGGLAHDFNNLLTVIVGNLGSLKDRIDGTLISEYVDPTIRASQRGVDVIGRLLAFARQQSLEPCGVDIARLVTGTAELLRRSLPSNITIQCTSDADVWPALADPAQLEGAIVNLALNARDAMSEGGVLSFNASCERLSDESESSGGLSPGEYVRIDVIDSGSGIPLDVQPRIFEPFFTTKPFGTGSGLGLSMVLGFARQSGGDVRIRTELGKGTCMSLVLPRAHEIEVESVVPAPGAIAGQGRLALLVEDHEEVRQTIRRQLLELGYQVLEARDAEDAGALLSSVPDVAVLVSDIIMPGAMTGLGLADMARKIIPGIKIVLMSGYANWSKSGYDWFDERLVLRKPFGRAELTTALREAP